VYPHAVSPGQDDPTEPENFVPPTLNTFGLLVG
jgi:hypothetical protein